MSNSIETETKKAHSAAEPWVKTKIAKESLKIKKQQKRTEKNREKRRRRGRRRRRSIYASPTEMVYLCEKKRSASWTLLQNISAEVSETGVWSHLGILDGLLLEFPQESFGSSYTVVT